MGNTTPVVVTSQRQRGCFHVSTAPVVEQLCWGSANEATKRSEYYWSSAPECSYKKQKLEHQKGKLGQGINVQKKQLCCDLRTRKQAGHDSLGAYDATTDVRVVSL